MAEKGITGGRELALILLAVAFWAVSFPVLKVALENNGAMALATWRMVITAAIAMAILVLIRGRRRTLDTLRAEWPVLLIFGMLYWAVPNVTQNIGMTLMDPDTSATVSGILQCSGPIFTVALAMVFLRERPGVKTLIGLLIALAGSVLMVTSGGTDFSSMNFWGNFLLLTSALSYSLGAIVGKQAMERIGPFDLVALSAPFGAVCTALCWPLLETPGGMDSTGWLSAAYLATLAGVFAVYIWFDVMDKAGISRLQLFVYLIPITSAAISVIFLGEEMSAATYGFGALVIAGIVVAQL